MQLVNFNLFIQEASHEQAGTFTRNGAIWHRR